jgi:class 3 adenylate cyclase
MEQREATILFADLRGFSSMTGYRAADLHGRVVSTHRAEGAHRFGVEFTSMSRETGLNIRKLVHLLIQGTAGE